MSLKKAYLKVWFAGMVYDIKNILCQIRCFSYMQKQIFFISDELQILHIAVKCHVSHLVSFINNHVLIDV